MIQLASTLAPPRPAVARNLDLFAHLTEIRTEAAREVAAVFSGIPGKRVDAAALPGFGRHGLSRAMNGSESNPVARLGGWFVLARRLGIPKSKLQRIIDLLQAWLDEAYGDEPTAELEEVLDKDAELDGRDDLPRQRAARGDKRALVELLEIEQEQLALGRTVILTVRRRLAEQG